MEAIPKFPFGTFALALVSRSERAQRMSMIGAPSPVLHFATQPLEPRKDQFESDDQSGRAGTPVEKERYIPLRTQWIDVRRSPCSCRCARWG